MNNKYYLFWTKLINEINIIIFKIDKNKNSNDKYCDPNNLYVTIPNKLTSSAMNRFLLFLSIYFFILPQYGCCDQKYVSIFIPLII